MAEQYWKLLIADEDGKILGAYYVGDNWEPNGDTEPPDAIVYLRQDQFSFELGAKAGPDGANPTLGTGGALVWYTKDEFTNGARINLQIYVKSIGGSGGVGTGSYELYLPEEITLAEDYYSGHANLHTSGGGISEFDGSVKWTFRNEEKGPKLIFTFDGTEWTKARPKQYADLKLRASISYFL